LVEVRWVDPRVSLTRRDRRQALIEATRGFAEFFKALREARAIKFG
jgi:hypothetical protein